jgi:hypothetical protein
MRLAVRADGGLLVVGAQGRFSLKEAKRTFLELLEAADRHATGKVLFDGRQLTGNPAMMERFYYGAFAAETVLTFARRHPFSAMQFAYVLKEPVLDPARFGETVARNRGMLVRAFDDLDAAMEWLGSPPAARNDS